MLAANTFYEFVSQVDGFQTGAVERRQMAVGTGCRGSTASRKAAKMGSDLCCSFFTKTAKAQAESMRISQ